MKRNYFLLASLFLIIIVHAQKKEKNVEHPFLGIDVGIKVPRNDGLYINGIYKGYGAEKAGLRSGDILQKIGDDEVHSLDEYITILRSFRPEDNVTVSYKRDNKLQTVEVQLSEYPDFLVYIETHPLQLTNAKLGVYIEPVWEKYGVKVIGFFDDAPGKIAGIKEGDIIFKMNEFQFSTAEELRYYLSKFDAGITVILSLERNGNMLTMPVSLGMKNVLK